MESNDKIENIKVEVSVEFIKSVRNLIEVVNDRVKWKSEELLPVGIIIKQLDDLLKNNNN
jgi:hypothetical protein